MSESAATIIKILSALTSPKASVKYIAVGVFMLLTWSNISKYVDSYGIPAEHQSLIVLFIGLGLGSLIGQLVYISVDFGWSKYKITQNLQLEKQNITEATKKKEEEKNCADKELLANLEKSYPYYDHWAKDVLRKLSQEEKGLQWSDYYVRILQDNGYIQKILNIDTDTNLYRLHPALTSFVASDWKNEIDNHLNEFFEDYTEDKKLLIKLLIVENAGLDTSIDSKVIDVARYYRTIFDIEAEDRVGFYISIEKPYYESIDNKLNIDIADETYILKARISQIENVV
ncbi:hypothetical protein [Photobacterium indicum]|uniref:hypothetical protein n=1 Tax=Photobacterium indicum TaxID=81447 RepID=UPI003D151731